MNKKLPWKPEEGERYFTLSMDTGLEFYVTSVVFFEDCEFDKENIAQNNYFKTEKEAEEVLKEISELLKNKKDMEE